jgi:hypothetical protein
MKSKDFSRGALGLQGALFENRCLKKTTHYSSFIIASILH